MDKKTTRISNLLIFLSVLSFPLTFGTIVLQGTYRSFSGGPMLATVETNYSFVCFMQFGLLYSILPWIGMIWGSRKKIRQNIVIGRICGLIAVVIGIGGLIGAHTNYTTNYRYAAELGETVGFDFPDSGKLILEWEKTAIVQTSTDGSYREYSGIILFDPQDAAEMESRIAEDSRFVEELPEEADAATPFVLEYYAHSYSACMLYSPDSGSVNAPEADDRNFILLLYNNERGAMMFYSYTLKD